MAKTTTSDSLPDAYYYDKDAADLICEFFPRFLVHTKGEWGGKPLRLEGWQERDIIRPLFGIKKKSDGLRRYKTFWGELPRKNSKSTTSSGIGAVVLFTDDEPGAEIYSAATDKEQAKITFNAGKEMILSSPKLREKCKIYKDAIEYKNRIWRALSADALTKDGLNAHMLIIDEIHAHRNRELIDVLITSMGSRRQPITLLITTAGMMNKQSIAWEYHDYALKVQRGLIKDDTFLPVIYAADPEKDDWRLIETAIKANPNYGISVKPEYIQEKLNKALTVPGFENTYKRLHLNIWTGQEKRWLPDEAWAACLRDYDLEFLKGRPCYGGLDLSSTQDLSAFALVFPLDNGEFAILIWFWCPKEKAFEREQKDRVKYTQWIEQGLITATEGNVVDQDAIERDILALWEIFDIKEIAVDRWNSSHLTTRLTGHGLTMTPFGQGFASMSNPTKELERLVLAKKLWQNGHAVLGWNFSNIAIRTDPAGNIKFDKNKASEKIDGMVAVVMGLGRAIVALSQDEQSIYEERGIVSF